MILMSKMENNTVNKAGSTGVELNLNDGTQRYQVTKKDLKKTADRYNFMACNIFNYESQMGPAVAWAMAPVLRKIYKKDEEYKEALNNHFNYFNSTTVMSSMILAASDSASHPFMVANSPSSSLAFIPSSSVKSSLA